MSNTKTLGMIESQWRVSLLQAEVLEEISENRTDCPENKALLDLVIFKSNMLRALFLDAHEASDQDAKFVASCAVVTEAIELAAAAIRLASEGDHRYDYEFPHS